MDNALASQIRNNNLKVFLAMTILTIVIGLLGSLLSYYCNWGLTGTGGALIVAGLINFLSFYFSDKIILRITRATPITREQSAELYQMVERLCAKAQIPVPKLYVLEDNTMNAFATGRDYKHSAVAVTTGLLAKMTPDEIESVLAHELSHIVNYDMRTMTMVSIIAGLASILADLYWSTNFMHRAQSRDPSGVLAIIGAVLSIFTPISAFFIQRAISRKREFVADADSARLTGNPKALASALQKISLDFRLPKHISASTAHLYFSTPAKDSIIDKLFSTHPPIEERIKQLEGL